MDEEPAFMSNMIPALRKEKQLEADYLTAVLKLDEPFYVLGDSITETWGPCNGYRVTRTYMGEDGKLHSERIDPKDFYDG